jgi:hypothetical protein
VARKTRQTRQQAAVILDRIADVLPMPASVAGYLHGYAAALRSPDERPPRQRAK